MSIARLHRPHRPPLIRALAGLITASLMAAGLVVVPGYVTASEQPPDIVVIMVDDLGPIPGLLERLPNIRRLFIDQGISFTSAIGETPLCCPARAGFLTGLHTHKHGVTVNDGTLFDPRETLATALQRAGYWTALAGKYLNNLGAVEDKTPPGWDRTAIMAAGYYDYDMWLDGELQHRGVETTDYSTDVFRDHALDFLANAPAGPRFMLFTPYAPHQGSDRAGVTTRRQPVPADRHARGALCADSPPLATPAYMEEDVSDKPAYIQARPRAQSASWPTVRTCQSLRAVDQAIKKLEVAESGRDVLWILTADNGLAYGSHRWWRKVVPYTTQVPLYVNWAAGRGTTPRSEGQAVSNIDMAPTLCAIAGCALGPVDGLDWSALLTDAEWSIPRDEVLEQSPVRIKTVPAWWALRSKQWHYVRYETGERELYRLTSDPWELSNLAGNAEYADVEAYHDARLNDALAPR